MISTDPLVLKLRFRAQWHGVTSLGTMSELQSIGSTQDLLNPSLLLNGTHRLFP